jgi:hypothetical protein
MKQKILLKRVANKLMPPWNFLYIFSRMNIFYFHNSHFAFQGSLIIWAMYIFQLNLWHLRGVSCPPLFLICPFIAPQSYTLLPIPLLTPPQGGGWVTDFPPWKWLTGFMSGKWPAPPGPSKQWYGFALLFLCVWQEPLSINTAFADCADFYSKKCHQMFSSIFFCIKSQFFHQ